MSDERKTKRHPVFSLWSDDLMKEQLGYAVKRLDKAKDEMRNRKRHVRALEREIAHRGIRV